MGEGLANRHPDLTSQSLLTPSGGELALGRQKSVETETGEAINTSAGG
jgi:hypothetical protein